MKSKLSHKKSGIKVGHEANQHQKAAHSSSTSVTDKTVKKWGIKRSGKSIGEIKVKHQNSYFFPEESQDKNILKEPEVLTYSAVQPLLEFLAYNQKETAVFLEVDPGTISRWKKGKNEIGKLRTKNMKDVDEIVAKGIRIFGNEKNFKTWLNTTNDALGDIKPVELIKDPYGVAQVEEAIEALSWGTYL